MKTERVAGFGSIALGLGIIASALLGPLVFGVIEFRVSEGAEGQLIGGDVVSLGVAGPLAIIAGALWLRWLRIAPLLAIGPALYSVYMYFQLIIGPDYVRYDGNSEDFFPLFIALVAGGWMVAVAGWTSVKSGALPEPPAALRRAAAGLMVFLSLVFALTWAVTIADVLNGGAPVEEYEKDPTLYWLVRTMDLGFVVPAGLVAGAGLLMRRAWAVKLAYAFLGVQTLLAGAVAGMAVNMQLTDDPAAEPVLMAVTLVASLALAAVYALMLRNIVVGRRPFSDSGRPGGATPRGGRSGRFGPLSPSSR
jgi:hypothetical protein